MIPNSLYSAIGVCDRNELKQFSKSTGINLETLDYYNDNNILPFEEDLNKILSFTGLNVNKLKLKMGVIDAEMKLMLSKIADSIDLETQKPSKSNSKTKKLSPDFTTELGSLYKADCITLMKQMKSGSVDLIFADPPFNLNKFYLSNINDSLSMQDYINWTEQWLEECIRILKPGGSFFLWNIPKWNTYFSEYLNNRMSFRHWIATDIKLSLPIANRLYPAHYSLLYYVKGSKPNAFHPDRMPMEVCQSCYTDLKDYGGYKDKMNSKGVNLTDVWYDIPPVRHTKFKRRKEANELSVKLLDRIIEMASDPGDVVFDPFGGSGTTYAVAEMKARRWIGVELGPLDDIINRFDILGEEYQILNKYRANYNYLFPTKVKAMREKLNLWTDDTFKVNKLENVESVNK